MPIPGLDEGLHRLIGQRTQNLLSEYSTKFTIVRFKNFGHSSGRYVWLKCLLTASLRNMLMMTREMMIQSTLEAEVQPRV
jgi:hypothetical protein